VSALADLVVVLHFAFVLFVVLGGLLVLRWPSIAWVHVPAAAWGTIVELTGWICPLTPLENWLRQRGGAHAYRGDFVGRYVVPALYPEGLTREIQLMLGVAVVVLNALIYTVVIRRRLTRR
jgi:Protein of Unknown function (DUF2784)